MNRIVKTAAKTVFILFVATTVLTLGLYALNSVLQKNAFTIKITRGTVVETDGTTAYVEYEGGGKTCKVSVKGDYTSGDIITLMYPSSAPENASLPEDVARIYDTVAMLYSSISKLLPYMLVFGVISLIVLRVDNRNSKAMEQMIKKEPEYWKHFYESMLHIRSGELSSAREMRERNISSSYDMPGYDGLSEHDMMTLMLFHCANGEEAYRHGMKALEEPEFEKLAAKLRKANIRSLTAASKKDRRAAEELKKMPETDGYQETLMLTAMLANSYEEAETLLARAEKSQNQRLDAEIAKRRQYRKDYPRWFNFQRAMSFNYYSRTSEDKDAGDYGPACSMLRMMLERAEQPGYDLSYDEYLDLMDDYLLVSYKYYDRMQKTFRAAAWEQARTNPIMRNQERVRALLERELSFILSTPISLLKAFVPDLKPQDRKLIINDLEPYKESYPPAQNPEFAEILRQLEM